LYCCVGRISGVGCKAPLQSAVSSQSFIFVSDADYGLQLQQVQTRRKFKLQLTLVIRLYFFSEDGSDSEKSDIGNAFPIILKGKISCIRSPTPNPQPVPYVDKLNSFGLTQHTFTFAQYNQQDASFHNLFISVGRCTCFRRFFRPSSGAQNCT